MPSWHEVMTALRTQHARYPLTHMDLLKKWLVSMKRVESSEKMWMPTKSTKLSSAHFLSDWPNKTAQS
ncbi:hypothetical protein PoB_007000300 [Plakobranchus ocellatus]|uniref:Uncharacterized protein n=1 Tax=Plakobranchus ocellatus TaxID=259542 RepID=A0AAV4DGZ6_9GAST|nr:hypothetical protein PoB_007000300 [Plakobranchus ocellatus]